MSGPLDRLGVVYPTHGTPEDFLAFARRVEQLGFGHLWVVEDCFRAGGLTLAATALSTTARLRVGVGLMPAPVRNPAIAAMEIATLARAHPRRFTATFGHGALEWMRQIGAAPRDRLGMLEETVVAIGALLDGRTVTSAGEHVRLRDVELELPPAERPELLIGSTGPRGLELAGKVADGMLLPEGCGADFIRWALAQAERGRADAVDERGLPGAGGERGFLGAGGDPGGAGAERRALRCVVYAWLSLDEDPRRAAELIAPSLAKWSRSAHYPMPQRLAGLTPARDADAPHTSVVSPPAPAPPALDATRLARLAERVAICGDARMCAAAVERLHDAGADAVMLVAHGPDELSRIERFVDDVAPLLGAR